MISSAQCCKLTSFEELSIGKTVGQEGGGATKAWRLIGKGLYNTEIADELCISGVTVKSYIGRIFGKLGLRDRAAAIVYAYDNGIVAPR